MNRFRDRFAMFMAGRNGVDQLSRFINVVALLFLVVSLFISHDLARFIVSTVGILLMVYSYFRIFSKNYPARNKENQWFCRLLYGRKQGYTKANTTDKKTHKIFKCPKCKQKIRVPRHRGKICITCPKCRTEFIKKT